MEHIDPWLGIVFPYANFLMFVGLAWWFFRKPAAQAARKRREDFEALMQEATRARDEAKSRLDEMNRRYANIQTEMNDLQTNARQAAEIEAAKILSDAQRLATHLREEARRIADAEVARALSSLQKEIVETVRSSVTQKIKSEVDQGKHLSLVKKQIAELNTLRSEG